jgi:hypothetical protein
MDPWLGYGDLGGPSITGKGDFIINMQQITRKKIQASRKLLSHNWERGFHHKYATNTYSRKKIQASRKLLSHNCPPPTLPEAHGLWV